MERLLPPKLGALLALEPDVRFADRLRHVAEAAARAIGKLGELDLVKYEDSPIEASADLSLWEELAPVVGSTNPVLRPSMRSAWVGPPCASFRTRIDL